MEIAWTKKKENKRKINEMECKMDFQTTENVHNYFAGGCFTLFALYIYRPRQMEMDWI